RAGVPRRHRRSRQRRRPPHRRHRDDGGEVPLSADPDVRPRAFPGGPQHGHLPVQAVPPGITQLDEEGVVQVLRHPDRGEQEPILAAVGPMQYDVAVYRLENEFGAKIELTPTPYVLARRTDREGAERLRGRRNVEVVSRADGTLLALFTSPYHLEAAQRDLDGIVLDPILTT